MRGEIAEEFTGQPQFIRIGDQVNLIRWRANHPAVRGEGNERISGEGAWHALNLAATHKASATFHAWRNSTAVQIASALKIAPDTRRIRQIGMRSLR